MGRLWGMDVPVWLNRALAVEMLIISECGLKSIDDPAYEFKGKFTETICIAGGISAGLQSAMKSLSEKIKLIGAKEFQISFKLYSDADCNRWEEKCLLSVYFN